MIQTAPPTVETLSRKYKNALFAQTGLATLLFVHFCYSYCSTVFEGTAALVITLLFGFATYPIIAGAGPAVAMRALVAASYFSPPVRLRDYQVYIALIITAISLGWGFWALQIAGALNLDFSAYPPALGPVIVLLSPILSFLVVVWTAFFASLVATVMLSVLGAGRG